MCDHIRAAAADTGEILAGMRFAGDERYLTSLRLLARAGGTRVYPNNGDPKAIHALWALASIPVPKLSQSAVRFLRQASRVPRRYSKLSAAWDS